MTEEQRGESLEEEERTAWTGKNSKSATSQPLLTHHACSDRVMQSRARSNQWFAVALALITLTPAHRPTTDCCCYC